MAKSDPRPDISYEVLFDKDAPEGTQTYYNEGFPSLFSAKFWLENKISELKRTVERKRYRNFRIVRHEVVDREKVVRRIPRI